MMAFHGFGVVALIAIGIAAGCGAQKKSSGGAAGGATGTETASGAATTVATGSTTGVATGTSASTSTSTGGGACTADDQCVLVENTCAPNADCSDISIATLYTPCPPSASCAAPVHATTTVAAKCVASLCKAVPLGTSPSGPSTGPQAFQGTWVSTSGASSTFIQLNEDRTAAFWTNTEATPASADAVAPTPVSSGAYTFTVTDAAHANIAVTFVTGGGAAQATVEVSGTSMTFTPSDPAQFHMTAPVTATLLATPSDGSTAPAQCSGAKPAAGDVCADVHCNNQAPNYQWVPAANATPECQPCPQCLR